MSRSLIRWSASPVGLLAIAALAWLGCRSPGGAAVATARAAGAEVLRVEGAPYPHVLFWSAGHAARGYTTVYLEGDGDPARAARRRPPDATPRRTVALELWNLDPGPALYLGRPGQLDAPAPLEAWTTHRYGETVVESLIAALRAADPIAPDRPLVLVGFSGGGTLATLMAERLPRARALVTLGANLDVAAWTAARNEPPLAGSLDPATRPSLRRDLLQLHLQGLDDRTVPPSLTRAFLERQPAPRVRRFDGFDHDCCWTSVWPEILGALHREIGDGTPAARPQNSMRPPKVSSWLSTSS